MPKDLKVILILALLLLAAIAAILGIMASAEAVPAPIIEVDVEPVILVEPVTEFAPVIDVTLEPEIFVDIGQGAPRYDENDVIMAMKERDYPWPPKVFVPEHQHGRIWYVMVTFNVGVHSHKRLYIFDEPL